MRDKLGYTSPGIYVKEFDASDIMRPFLVEKTIDRKNKIKKIFNFESKINLHSIIVGTNNNEAPPIIIDSWEDFNKIFGKIC